MRTLDSRTSNDPSRRRWPTTPVQIKTGGPTGTASTLRIGPADYRGNMAAGGTPVKTSLTKRELEICARLKPSLQERGLYFVGIDVIGDWLTEVNVTSPTGIAEIDRLDNTNVAARVIDVAERLAGSR